MAFELGRANSCNRFGSILGEMRGSVLTAQDVRVENPRATASAPVRLPTIPIPGVPAATPRRRELARLLIAGVVVYAVVMGG